MLLLGGTGKICGAEHHKNFGLGLQGQQADGIRIGGMALNDIDVGQNGVQDQTAVIWGDSSHSDPQNLPFCVEHQGKSSATFARV